MKLPKTVMRYNPVLKRHTEHKVTLAKKRTPGQASPYSKMGKARTQFGKGHGNLGRYGSKPPVSKWKMAGKKRSKKVDIRFECTVSKKQFTPRKSFRAKKVEWA